MQIKNSAILLSSQRQFTQRATSSMAMRFWLGNTPPPPLGATNQPALRLGVPAAPHSPIRDEINISSAARQRKPATEEACECKNAKSAADQVSDPKMRMFVILMEKMLGRKFKVFDMAEVSQKAAAQAENQQATPEQPAAAERVGWGFELRAEESYYEAEQMAFAAQGVIQTKDGKSIQFQLQLEMSREYFRQDLLHIRLGDAALTDPLVINFDGNAAQLSDQTFKFNLDGQGEAEDVPTLASGSGFLALDKNGDGQITKGAELFGPTTGDGFQELAAYDDDHNGWIDSGDAVYNRLRIMAQTENKQQLFTLQEKNIGALYLNAINTSFTIKNSQNETLGQVAESSIFVKEDGNVGSVQRVDLAT